MVISSQAPTWGRFRDYPAREYCHTSYDGKRLASSLNEKDDDIVHAVEKSMDYV